MKRPKYFINSEDSMLYAVYPNKAYFALTNGWAPSNVLNPLEYFTNSPDYNECNLCDVRAIFPNIEAHKLPAATVAPGTQPA